MTEGSTLHRISSTASGYTVPLETYQQDAKSAPCFSFSSVTWAASVVSPAVLSCWSSERKRKREVSTEPSLRGRHW